MKLRFFLPLLFVFAPVCVLAQKGMIDGYTPTVAPVIDGKVDDWEIEWLGDSKGKFAYNIANDEENLYIRIRISDAVTQRKIALFGLTVFLNPTGKKMGKVGVKFPMEKDMDALKLKPQDGPMSASQLVQMNKDLIQDSEALELVGLSKKNIVSTRLGLTNGIQLIIVANDAGDYLYEGKLPFKAFNLKKEDIKVLGVTFQTGRLIAKSQPVTNAPPPGGGFGNRGYRNGLGGSNMNISRAPQYNEFNSSTTMSVGVILH